MLFGVQDEITDMTRSLEMVERERLIYRTMVFGHRKCSKGYRVHIGSPEGVPGNPGKDMGLMGQVREHTSPQGAGAPPIGPATWGDRERRGGKGKYEVGLLLPSPPPSFLSPLSKYGRGGRIGLGAQVGFLLLGRALGCLPPSPSFIYVGRAPLEHTSIVPSRVRRPLHS